MLKGLGLEVRTIRWRRCLGAVWSSRMRRERHIGLNTISVAVTFAGGRQVVLMLVCRRRWLLRWLLLRRLLLRLLMGLLWL